MNSYQIEISFQCNLTTCLDSGEELFIPGGGITKTLFHDW